MIYLNKKRMYEMDSLPNCILTVPSLNLKGRSHAVSWVNGELLDPNHGYAGRKTYGPDWGPFTVGASGAEILLKPMSKIQYEDLITMLMNDDSDLKQAIMECAA
jgi:hypothetical protein